MASGFLYVRGYIRASGEGGSRTALSLARTVFGMVWYLEQIVGSGLLIAGYGIVVYLAAGMVLFFASLISGAWLLSKSVTTSSLRIFRLFNKNKDAVVKFGRVPAEKYSWTKRRRK